MFALFCLVVLIGIVVYLTWRPELRIAEVHVFSEDVTLKPLVEEHLLGTYLGVIPKNSIFFFPADEIREAILATHANIAAVSFFRNGLKSISVRPIERTGVASWCGLALTPDVQPYCYVFDPNGYLFAARDTWNGLTLNSFVLYAPLREETQEPLRAHLRDADALPHVFDFARQIGTLGSPVDSIVIRDDEVDDILQSGTRITYVLGDEQQAYTALISAKKSLALTDGSIEYVDLRFEGKVYVKRTGTTE